MKDGRRLNKMKTLAARKILGNC